MRLTIHHLRISRSTRILWLAEELGLEYTLVEHIRDASFRSPDTLKAVHPLGKSPTVEIDGVVIAESGAIVEYLCDRAGKLAPTPDAADRALYLEWLHFGEGSAMMPLMLGLLTGSMGAEATAGVMRFFEPEIGKVLGHLDAAVRDRDYLLESGFGGADILNHYAVAAADFIGRLGAYPALAAYRDRLEARPAYQRAIEIGGPVFPPKR